MNEEVLLSNILYIVRKKFWVRSVLSIKRERIGIVKLIILE